jgi:hypothetical protein
MHPAATLTAALLATTIPFLPQDTKPAPAAPAAPAPPPGMTQADVDAYAAAAAPGEMHAWLAKAAGTWTGVSRNWPTPDAAPMPSTVTMNSRMDLGGRFLMNDVRAEWPEIGTFEGRATLGYDNAQRIFVSSWVDNMGTGIMSGTGQLADDRKTLTITYTYFDPAKKKQVTLREVTVRETDDRIWLRIWGTSAATGKEFLMTETTYTRVPQQPVQPTPAAPPARKRPLNDGRGDRD